MGAAIDGLQPIPAHRQHFPRFRMVPIKKRAAPCGTALHVLCAIECRYAATDYYFLVRTILVAENQV